MGKIGGDLDDSVTTSREMGIRRTSIDSPRRVGPFISHTAF
jgi:hypothetical protein